MESLLNILLLACLLGSGLVTCLVIVLAILFGYQLMEKNNDL
jgi:hypothetical protein